MPSPDELNAISAPTLVFAEDTSPVGELSPEQQVRLESLLPQAQQVMMKIEDRMVALTIAASSRWRPEQGVLESDENAAPVFGDREFDQFLALVEDAAENAWFQEISRFMGLPEAVINEVMTESLKSKMVKSPSNMPGAGVVVHKRHNLPRD